MDAQWCFDQCMQCGLAINGQATYCSNACQLAAAPPVDDESDDDYDLDDSPSYASWHRVSLWAQGVDPTPPPSPPVYASPLRKILTPQYPTACITSDSNPTLSKPRASPPRPARTSPTATESLVASSSAASPISLGGLVRSWAPRAQRPQLPRLTTANFTVFAKTHPPPPPQLLPSDESTSDGDVSPVWWVSQEPQTTTTASSPSSPRYVVQRRPPVPRGRKLARAVA